MKKIGLVTLALTLFVTVGCKNERKTTSDAIEDMTENVAEDVTNAAESLNDLVARDSKSFRVIMEPKSGSEAEGQVSFSESNGVVSMRAKFTNMTPGTHAIHLHEKADCSSDDGTSTGGHWNPTHERHGKWGDAEGYHKGDIGNFEVNEEGVGEITFETDEWCLSCEDETKNIIGKAVIVHESPDDFVTQPTGNAGGRISCGGIIQ